MTDLSVLMPVYNASRYPAGWVERAIDSVLEQPDISVELCIGDDGSDDGYLDRLHDNRIFVTRAGDHPSGGSRAADAAAGIAHGRYFIILSCRSWYERRALTAMVRHLDEHPEIGIVWGNTIRQHANGHLERKDAPIWNPQLFLRSFPTSFGYMYRREGYDRGARYDCSIQASDGTWFSIGDHYMLAQLVKMGFTGAPLRMQVLYYQYGHVPQAGDLLHVYRARLYEKFNQQLGAFHVEI